MSIENGPSWLSKPLITEVPNFGEAAAAASRVVGTGAGDQMAPVDTFPRMDVIVDELLTDPNILKDVPEEEQGRVILDRFIGSLVRHGDFQASGETVSAEKVIHLLSLLGSSAQGGDKVGLNAFTRNEGLRDAVRKIAEDPRAGGIMAKAAESIKVEADGSVTLLTPAQLEGYLLSAKMGNHIHNPVGGRDMHGDTWLPVIAEQLQRMHIDANVPWQTIANARDMTTSSSPLLRNSGNDWRMAVASAESRGVDMNLLQRSAESIQHRVRQEHDMGAAALFLATGNRIKTYKEDLDRRSGW